MELQEFALIIFTTVMQMAVGAFVVLGGVHFFAARRDGMEAADKMSDRALLAIGPAVVLALGVTFFHLGNPANAPGAIANLGSSWLSREIGLALVFTIGGAVFAFMQWRKIGSAGLRNAIALIVAAVGLVLVYAMAAVYRLPAVPAWNSLATPVSFYLTTFLLGALAIGAAYTVSYIYLRGKAEKEKEVQFSILATTLRWIALISVALLGLQFIVIPVYLASLATNSSAAAAESLSRIFTDNSVIFTLRLVLIFLGAGVFSIFVYQSAASEKKLRIVGTLAFLAFALVLVSELLGRYLFYASMVRVGI